MDFAMIKKNENNFKSFEMRLELIGRYSKRDESNFLFIFFAFHQPFPIDE